MVGAAVVVVVVVWAGATTGGMVWAWLISADAASRTARMGNNLIFIRMSRLWRPRAWISGLSVVTSFVPWLNVV